MRLTLQSMEPALDQTVRAVARRVARAVPWTVKTRRAPAGSDNSEGVIRIDASPAVAAVDEGITVGITGRHIEVPGLDDPFGYAFPADRVAVVSTPPLRSETGTASLFEGRLCKEVIHEAGHVLGMPHCMNQTCVMHYSQALHDTDSKGCTFCPACALELSKLPGIGRESRGR